MPITTRRQSSTVRITWAIIRLLARATAAGEGVIVRHRGAELGLIGAAVDSARGQALEGDIMLRDCTIRRTTVDALQALYA